MILANIIRRIKYYLNDIWNNKPLRYIMLFNLILHFWGITWGLPNKEAWAIDAVVPNILLRGLAKGFSFGFAEQYPNVHLVLLSVLLVPVFLVAAIDLFASGSWGKLFGIIGMSKKGGEPLDVFNALNAVINIDCYASAMILIGNAVSALMSIGIVYAVYRIARELFDERSALFAALLVGFNAAFNYYAHVANVDVPYMFWALGALYYLIQIGKRGRRSDYIACAVLTAISFGTKDQAYAIFILPFIIYLIGRPLKGAGGGDRSSLRRLLSPGFIAFAIAFVLSFIVVENLVLNASGFVRRVQDMLGPNSQSYMSHTKDLAGYTRLFLDVWHMQSREIIGLPILVLSMAGVGFVVVRYRGQRGALSDRLMLVYAALSFTIFFDLPALRADCRFYLPQGVFAAIYAGFAISYLLEHIPGRARPVLYGVIGIVCLYSLYLALNININLAHDVRYEAQRWMESHIPKGSTIERYSGYAYLPIFSRDFKEYRVKRDFLDIEKRRPDYIIETSLHYPRFFEKQDVAAGGRKVADRTREFQKSDIAVLMRRLFGNQLRYRMVKRFDFGVPCFHASFFAPDHIVIFQRIADDPGVRR